jgi:hypothetical protein
MYILVLRDVKKKQSFIWQSKQLGQVSQQLQRFLRKRKYGHNGWNAAAELYLLKHYGIIHTRTIAAKCSKLLRRPITRNAVIGRYRDLKKARDAQTLS